jgi:hypothetical protein
MRLRDNSRRVLVALLCVLPLALFAGVPGDRLSPALAKLPAVHGDSTIVFVSDTQQPIWIETLALAKNHNEHATQMIFANILQERPNAVVHFGDMVAWGFDHSSWTPLDTFRVQLHRLRIPLFPALGNHELLLFSAHGEEAFKDRFPFASKTGYSIRVGKLAVVILNSNFSKLSGAERKEEESWYTATLNALEADSTVRMIAVGCHHSPYTNSTIVTPSEEIQKTYLPLFFQTKKCRVFISGHAHASERFRMNGKDFFVIGGGGGLQQPLLIGKDQRWEDLTPLKTRLRMFHYLSGNLTAAGLVLTVKMLKEDFSSFYDLYTVTIPWPD